MVKYISENSIQKLLNKYSDYLNDCKESYGYKEGGVTIIELIPENNCFDLGVNFNTYGKSTSQDYACEECITFVLNETPKVITQEQNSITKAIMSPQTMYNILHPRQEYLSNGIEDVKKGNMKYFNRLFIPICTSNDKSCCIYAQFIISEPNTLSLIINFRAQHIFMLNRNLQTYALLLLKYCHLHDMKLGSLKLNANQFHCKVEDDVKSIKYDDYKKWLVSPKSSEELITSINGYFNKN